MIMLLSPADVQPSSSITGRSCALARSLARSPRRHGQRRGTHPQGGQVSLGAAGGVHPELHLAARDVRTLQLHPERHLGRRERAHVADHPHHRGGLLGGVRGGLGGQLSGHVCHHQVSHHSCCFFVFWGLGD